MMARTKIFDMPFSKVYPLYINKVERKGKSINDLNTIIKWLTGYTDDDIIRFSNDLTSFKAFFDHAPKLNPNRNLIKGVICGIRVETIEDELMQNIRYLDKLVDELSKGKKMDSILRK
jgi:hypothetical protein